MATSWDTADLCAKNVYLDLAAFYNQYYDLFSEDIIGATFLENTPAPPHHLLPAHFGNGLMGVDDRRRNRARVEANELLAASRLLFVPAHGPKKEPRFAGRWHVSGHRRLKPGASGDDAVVV